jgi:putative RNA 2'-phosphotransferase
MQSLLDSLRKSNSRWAWLSQRDVLFLVETDVDDRFEHHNGRIRALYGHSVAGVQIAAQQPPPPVLYHATSAELLPTVLAHGLKPMRRCYVHLTSDRAYAERVGSGKFLPWVLLAVDVAQAVRSGIKFYRANRHVWQTSFLEARLLRVLEQD